MPPRAEPTRSVASLPIERLAAEASATTALPARTPLQRALVYGTAGLGLEVVFTGISRGLQGDKSLTGTSYVWMLPIYALGGLVLERVRERTGERRWWRRGLRYAAAIYAVEYVAGAALRKALGKCPWQYERGVHVSGLIRLDYAPFWLGAGLLFERLHERLQVGNDAKAPHA